MTSHSLAPRRTDRFLFTGFSTLMLSVVLLMSALSSAQTLTSITIVQIVNKSAAPQLPVMANRQFTAYANFSDGSQQYVTQQAQWSSAAPTIATVTPTMGLVTATGVGTVNITATYQGISGSSSLTTIAATLTVVSVTPANWAMQTGSTQQFNATASYGGATTQDVTQTARWKSSNTAIATVSATGIVTAVGAGSATISAAFQNRSGSNPITVTTTPAPNLGLWTAPQSLGMIGIHAALLNTGNVLLWGYPIGRAGGPSPVRLLNPTTGALTDLTLPFPTDIFCSGQSFLADGRLLVDGGLNDGQYPADAGIPNTTFFDPSTSTWSVGPVMVNARWYPTTVRLPNGNVLALGGTDGAGKYIIRPVEEYNPSTNAWTLLPKSAQMPPHPDDYALITVQANGNVFYAAPREDSQMYNPTSEKWSFVANMNTYPRAHANSVILPLSQKVMVVGGAQTVGDGGGTPTATTEVIDFSQSAPAWSYLAPMNIPRYNMNFIYLADGTLISIGGNQASDYTSPVVIPEIYDPVANAWTEMLPQVAGRGYHSTAVLLPDGRVLSAGSDSGKSLENTYEIYSPPYLFKGPRPSIASAPTTLNYNQQFTITTPDAATITRVALIPPTATTHANHMDDDRYVDLSFQVGSGQITAVSPNSTNNAPPGYYMLVIVNSNGVPSVMPFVQMQSTAKK